MTDEGDEFGDVRGSGERAGPGDPDLPDTEAGWRERLTEEAYLVLRRRATEPARSGAYLGRDDAGTYRCAGCGAPLFDSATKFDGADANWPAFADAIDGAVRLEPDVQLRRRVTEVLCATCDGHLGHVFGDGPEPTGDRYCVNSVALDFRPE